jgi:hypothetical protein
MSDIRERIDAIFEDESLNEFSLFSPKKVFAIIKDNGKRFITGIEKNGKDIVVDAWKTKKDALYVAKKLMGFKNFTIKMVDSKGSHIMPTPVGPVM